MKYLSWIVLLIFSSFTLAIEKDVAPDTCQSPRDCISKIYRVLDRSRSPGQSPSLKEQAIIRWLLDLGEEAMPFIVRLLEEDEELIARIGAVALRETESINEAYFPHILKGLEKGVPWLAPALAKIGTLEAAEVAVKRFLVSDSAPHNQEAYTLELFGERAFSTIIRAAKCEFGCNDKTYYLLGYVLGEMEESSASAAESLIAVVEDRSLSVEIREGFLYMISFLDRPGLVIEDNLLKIKENETQFTDATNRALIGIKSRYAGKIYADMLANGTIGYMLRDLAELGTSGNEAGRSIIDLLDSDDQEERLMAARTLGFIEYIPAAPELIQLLNDPSDVQLNWVAAESLGRMKSEIAIPALESTAKNHWYSPVREAANNAIEHIKSGKAYASIFHKRNFPFYYFKYEDFGLKPCKNVTLEAKPEPEDQKLYQSYAKEQLESLAYQSVILSYGVEDEGQQRVINPSGIIEVNENNVVEHWQEVKQVPRVALRLDDGWLAGSNRGEWGGELVYVSGNSNAIKILDENIIDIYKLGERYIAITGLAHLATNKGMIYELLRDKDGYWYERKWLALPGSPLSSWFVETGEILINTSGGGSVLLSKSGGMRMAICK